MSEGSGSKASKDAVKPASGEPIAAAEAPKGAKPAATVDPFTEFREMLAEQSERQGRLRHVQQFLNSPTFVDLRDQPMVVSDPPEVIEERKNDLDYRIRVLESVISLLIEERDSLDKASSAQPPKLRAAE